MWNCEKLSHPHLNSNRTKLHTIDRHKQQLKLAGITVYSKGELELFKK